MKDFCDVFEKVEKKDNTVLRINFPWREFCLKIGM